MSCGPGPYNDETRIQLYHSAINVSKNLYPFFYSSYTLNSHFSEYNAASYYLPYENIEEWNNYAGGNYKLTDIYEFIYEYPVRKLNGYDNFDHIKNSFAKHFISENRIDVIHYIAFAKDVEKELNNYDNWVYVYDKKTINVLIERAKKIISTTDDVFLKQRYSYQIIVMYRYLKEFREAIKFYNDNFSDIPEQNESILKYWALTHVAYCKVKTDNKIEAQKDILTAFYKVDLKKRYIFQNIDIDLIESFYNQLDDEQKYSYLILKQLKNPGPALKDLIEIGKIEAENQQFILLMNREINKLDNWLLSEKYSGYGNYYLEENKDSTYLKEFTEFAKDIYLSSSDKNKPMWEIFLSHLYFLQNDAINSEKYLNKIDENQLSTDELKLQFHIDKILMNLIKYDSYNNAQADAIYTDLNYILSDTVYEIEVSKLLQSVFKAMYFRFTKTNNHEIAALILGYVRANRFGYDYSWWTIYSPKLHLDKYANIQQVEKYIDILDNTGNNDFEKLFVIDDYDYDKNEFYDLMGTIKLRENDLQAALEYYKKVDTNYYYNNEYRWYLETNPFMNEFLTEYEQILDGRFYNKAFFVEQLITKLNEFKQATGNIKGQLALELANAYYNMSYYGNSWFYDCYGWSVYGGDLYYSDFNTTVNENYKTCNTAFEYYDVAIKNFRKKRDKAKAYFIAASIYTQINTHDARIYWYYDDQDKYTNKENAYFNDFKTNLPNEFDFYLGSCKF